MPNFGWRHSDETRAHLSSVNVGRRHSPETRAKIAAAGVCKHSNKAISVEHRAAVSAALKGVDFTPEHCELISLALLDYYARTRPCGPAERRHREARRIYNLRARRKGKS
jgi:hypothetical protein